MPANPLEWQSLARKNRNPRDLCIEFDEPTHRYTVNGVSNGWISWSTRLSWWTHIEKL
jgi:hypothetical protein